MGHTTQGRAELLACARRCIRGQAEAIERVLDARRSYYAEVLHQIIAMYGAAAQGLMAEVIKNHV